MPPEEPNLRHKVWFAHRSVVCTLTLGGTGELLKTDCSTVNLKKCLGNDNRDMAKNYEDGTRDQQMKALHCAVKGEVSVLARM